MTVEMIWFLASSGLFCASAALATPSFEISGALKHAGRTLREIVWEKLPYPEEGTQAQYEAQASTQAEVDGKVYHTEYVVLARSGDDFGGNLFGQIVGEHGNGLKDPQDSSKPFISANNDFSSMLPKGKEDVYIITHFESPEPEVTYFSKAKQNLQTGEITIKHTEPLDWSKYGGLWTPCAGSVTPWQTHLGSEEYEPDARAWQDAYTTAPDGQEWLDIVGGAWNLYFQLPDSATNKDMYKVMFPYSYGYSWEVAVDEKGDISYQTKHMAAGRYAIELAYVMPDNKTMYTTDDGDNVMFSKFVASKAGSLECGAIYGAKFTQLSAEAGGRFTLEWIEVGAEACDRDFEPHYRTTTFYDLFATAEPDASAASADAICPEGFATVNVQPGGLECLKIKPGMELLASRFETRRVAAMKGCTTEWSKWEGITLDTTRYKLYTSLSEVRRGMEDFGDEGKASEEYDLGGPNDIKLPWNPCGCVYTLELDDSWSATEMYALECGTPTGSVDDDNACAVNDIASPDNVVYVPHHDAVLIGEDTSFHVNNLMWYKDLADGSLTRIYSVPVGAEVTGPYVFPNIRGFMYIQAVAQHPLAGVDDLTAEQDTGSASYLGYIGPFEAPKGSVDMAAMAPVGGRLWNDFPADGRKGVVSGHPGHSEGGHKGQGKGKGNKHGHRKHARMHAHGKEGKRGGNSKHGMKHYIKPEPGTSRKRSAAHHSAAAKRMAHR